MERFEARLEVDNREAAADNMDLMSCSVAHTEHFVDNILADNKASNRFPDEVGAGVVVGCNNHMDLEDMLDNAFDALVENSRAVGDAAHTGRAVLVLSHHLKSSRVGIDSKRGREKKRKKKKMNVNEIGT